MKSFISQNVQRIIDFNNSLLDTSCAQTCVSITGDKLHILGQLSTIVKFCQSKVAYLGDFLVSDNIQYDCVLGWDFIHHHQLSIHSKGPGEGYFLAGRHGNTCIRDNRESTTANLVGITHTSEQRSATDRMLCQSTFSKQRRRCFA